AGAPGPYRTSRSWPAGRRSQSTHGQAALISSCEGLEEARVVQVFIADEQFLGVERVGAQQFARAHKMLDHGLSRGFGGPKQMGRAFLPRNDTKVGVGDPLGIQ